MFLQPQSQIEMIFEKISQKIPTFFEISITVILSVGTYLFTYFYNLAMTNREQYLSIVAVVFLDGWLGICAGIKREGFRTNKAITVLKTTFVWIMILNVILMVEKGFEGTAWLSEVIIVPFIVLQLISALKNASMAGFIKISQLNKILDLIDKHKGIRDDKPKKITNPKK